MPINIFDHGGFCKDAEKSLKESTTVEELSDRLNKDLMYYFWCRFEYEIYVKPLHESKECGQKIDIYNQVKMNWEVFVDYVWRNGKEHR